MLGRRAAEDSACLVMIRIGGIEGGENPGGVDEEVVEEPSMGRVQDFVSFISLRARYLSPDTQIESVSFTIPIKRKMESSSRNGRPFRRPAATLGDGVVGLM